MKFLKIAFFCGLICAVQLSCAGHSGSANAAAFGGETGGGGNWTEADLKHFLSNLSIYLASPDGRAAFPEVAAYDATHPNETVERIMTELNPSIVDRPVHDDQSRDRDCVSDIKMSIRYFQCNSKSLPPKPDESSASPDVGTYYGTMYRLVLHEAFVQAGLEQPLMKEVPSEYPISSRLTVHLENFPEWVPGVASQAASNCEFFIDRIAGIVNGPNWGEGEFAVFIAKVSPLLQDKVVSLQFQHQGDDDGPWVEQLRPVAGSPGNYRLDLKTIDNPHGGLSVPILNVGHFELKLSDGRIFTIKPRHAVSGGDGWAITEFVLDSSFVQQTQTKFQKSLADSDISNIPKTMDVGYWAANYINPYACR